MINVKEPLSRRRSYDLNGILQFANIAIVLLTLYLYALNDDNKYIDNYTIAIFLVFGFQNGMILLWERRSREPLIMILMLTIIPFYMLRVATLLYEPWSVPLIRFPFSPDNMNHALLFIMFCVLSMTIGIKIFPVREGLRRNSREIEPKADNTPHRLFSLMLVITTLDLLSVFGNKVFGAFQGFISIAFNADILLILLFAVYAIKGDRFTNRQKFCYLSLFAAFIVVRTVSGSRGALLTTALSVLFVSFSIYREVTVRKHVVVLLIAMLPLAAVVFSVTTYWRPYRIAKLEGAIDSTPVEFIIGYSSTVTIDSFEENIKLLLRPMFDRVGYLDMSADMITNADKYNILVNPIYYFKSVVDNVLTPGFDIFDVPRAGNNMISIYNHIPLLNRTTADTFYQSDMLTIFGEYYVLFGGYFAVLGCFLTGFFSKLCFAAISFKNNFWYYSCRAVYFKLYLLSLWSFGLDWQAGDILFALISIASLYVLSVVKLPKITLTASGTRRLLASRRVQGCSNNNYAATR